MRSQEAPPEDGGAFLLVALDFSCSLRYHLSMEQTDRFSNGDILVLDSPHVDFYSMVNFRGYSGDKAIVVFRIGQMAVDPKWLSRPTDDEHKWDDQWPKG